RRGAARCGPTEEKRDPFRVPFWLRRFARSLSEQLDAGDVGAIADAMTQFEDARVAPRARGKPLADLGEQFVRDGLVLEAALDEPAGVQIAAARQRDQALREGTQLLRLRLGRPDAAVLEEVRGEIVQRRLLVARRARELAAFGAVTHQSSSAPVSWAC